LPTFYLNSISTIIASESFQECGITSAAIEIPYITSHKIENTGRRNEMVEK